MRKYNGAISLFMVVILLTCFIFGGVFIDGSRIIVAKSKVRNSMNSALRSAMSYYDKKLVSDYGMYAYNSDDAKDRFKKYFNANMTVKDDNINMFDYTIVKAEIAPDLLITDDAEFNRQLVEYSKYRAPVTTTMLLIEKVSSAFSSLNSKKNKISGAADSVDEFKDAFKRAGNQISGALRDVKVNVTNNIKNNFESELKKDPYAFAGKVQSTVNKEINKISNAVAEAEKDAQAMKAETDAYVNQMNQVNSELQAMENGSVETEDDGVTSYPTQTDNKKPLHEQAYNQVNENGGVFKNEITAIKTKAENLKTEINAAVGELQALYLRKQEKENDVAAKQTTYDEKKNVLNGMVTKLNDYNSAKALYDVNSEKSEKLKKEIDNIVNGYSADAAVTEVIKKYKNENKELTDVEKERKELRESYTQLVDLFDKIDDYETAVKDMNTASNNMNSSGGANVVTGYNSAVSDKDAAEAALNTAKSELSGIEISIKEKTEYVESKIGELENINIPTITELEESDIAKDAVNRLITDKIDEIKKGIDSIIDQLTGTMPSYNPEAEKDNIMGNGGLIKKVKSVCEYVGDAFSVLTNPEKLRDNAYTVDYIMDHCTYFTSPTARDTFFKRGEVEYIIFGNDTQVKCIFASVASIAMLRFAINFFDYAFRAPGDLIAKCIYGLGRGAAKTAIDLGEMFITKADEGVALCPSFKHIKLTYSDHLRLMLFIKFSDMQKKLKNVMGKNLSEDGININNLYTRMKADVTVEVNMLILPVFFGEFTGENFHDGKYVIKDSVVLGY